MNFKIQSINRHRLLTDGEGVTTLIGLYGCPLKCEYCINKDILHHYPWKEYTQEELLNVIMQDYCYFVATNGGITFGGGESLLQSKAIEELLSILPEHVNVTIETSLNVEKEKLIPLLEPVQHFIIDVKTLNPVIYQAYTHHSNERVIENLEYMAQQQLQQKCKVRVPRIPDFNDEEDIQATVKELQHMGFHNIDTFTYVIRDK